MEVSASTISTYMTRVLAFVTLFITCAFTRSTLEHPSRHSFLPSSSAACRREAPSRSSLSRYLLLRAQRQPVFVAHYLARDDFHAHEEVADHAPYDGNLLGVLFPEHGYVGADDVEQNGDYRRHPPEMPRAGLAAEIAAYVFLDDIGGGVGEVDVGNRRGEDGVRAGGLAVGGVRLPTGADICLKSSLGPNWVGLTKIETTTVSASVLAFFTRLKCPSCSAPIVGTRAIFPPFARADSTKAVISAGDDIIFIDFTPALLFLLYLLYF